MTFSALSTRIRFCMMTALCALLLAACGNPADGNGGGGTGGGSDGGSGEIRIGPVASIARTTVPGSTELAGMTFRVRFTGPGGTIDKDFGPEGGTVSLQTGTWNTAAKAYCGVAPRMGIARKP